MRWHNRSQRMSGAPQATPSSPYTIMAPTDASRQSRNFIDSSITEAAPATCRSGRRCQSCRGGRATPAKQVSWLAIRDPRTKKWAGATSRRKWSAFAWRRRRPKHWQSLWACSYSAGVRSSQFTLSGRSARTALIRYCSRSSSGWAIATRRLIPWFMRSSPKTFDSHSSASYAAASARGRASLWRAPAVAPTCPPYAFKDVRPVLRPAQRRTASAMRASCIRHTPSWATSPDDARLGPAQARRAAWVGCVRRAWRCPSTRFAIP